MHYLIKQLKKLPKGIFPQSNSSKTLRFNFKQVMINYINFTVYVTPYICMRSKFQHIALQVINPIILSSTEFHMSNKQKAHQYCTLLFRSNFLLPLISFYDRGLNKLHVVDFKLLPQSQQSFSELSCVTINGQLARFSINSTGYLVRLSQTQVPLQLHFKRFFLLTNFSLIMVLHFPHI